ncbi:unnamed protein product [Debaryomyces tyrocola]|nr:unnamed protein product [Debaryomyces tyrocola]
MDAIQKNNTLNVAMQDSFFKATGIGSWSCNLLKTVYFIDAEDLQLSRSEFIDTKQESRKLASYYYKSLIRFDELQKRIAMFYEDTE